MVRISDILKKKMQARIPSEEAKPKEKLEPQEKEKPLPEPETEVPAPGQPLEVAKAMAKQEGGEEKYRQMQIAKTMREIEPDEERSKDMYARGVQLIRELLNNIRERKPVVTKPIKDLLAQIINYFILGDKTLFALFYNDYAPEDYLCYHIMNTTMMSLTVGLRLGYNKSRLNELGLAAFLHDIGMVGLEDIYLKHHSLSEDEYNKIKKHPGYGADFLSQIKDDISQAVIDAVKEVHERINGKGYPVGRKDGEISEYARIIGIVDVYEALTHSRVYRKQIPPHETIKDMISWCGSLFEVNIFKLLIDQIGIYPIGSYAQLNSDEIAKVVTTNDDSLLRPVVKIIFDANKNRLEEPRLVNLAKEFNLYIKRPLSDEELSQMIKG